ncbi:hypothetical protein CIRG_09924 [Coccidioides immitis RMSCC 2394]|uniref:Uncharacterized protein n=1 Tax=Coccidioides immitis RMSCC 2394 TaxID=404692 RepID=A0A0J6YTC8_COCIT|nr:hypothetical protein CIRG_09924 [Coccidioides immitis RMSCC 2394]
MYMNCTFGGNSIRGAGLFALFSLRFRSPRWKQTLALLCLVQGTPKVCESGILIVDAASVSGENILILDTKPDGSAEVRVISEEAMAFARCGPCRILGVSNSGFLAFCISAIIQSVVEVSQPGLGCALFLVDNEPLTRDQKWRRPPKSVGGLLAGAAKRAQRPIQSKARRL